MRRLAVALGLAALLAAPAEASLLAPADRLDRGPVVTAGLTLVGPTFTADVPLLPGLALGGGTLGRFTLLGGDMEAFSTVRLTHVLWRHPDGWAIGYMGSVSRQWNRVGGVRDAGTDWSVDPAVVATVPINLPKAPARIRLLAGPAFRFASLSEPNPARYESPADMPADAFQWRWGLSLTDPRWRLAAELAVPLGPDWELTYFGGSFAAVRRYF